MTLYQKSVAGWIVGGIVGYLVGKKLPPKANTTGGLVLSTVAIGGVIGCAWDSHLERKERGL